MDKRSLFNLQVSSIYDILYLSCIIDQTHGKLKVLLSFLLFSPRYISIRLLFVASIKHFDFISFTIDYFGKLLRLFLSISVFLLFFDLNSLNFDIP